MEEIEGIVLKSLDYKDSERIITVFSKELGMVSLIIKGLASSSLHKLAITTPFCQAKFIFTRSKSELLRFRDSSILCEHLFLRQKLAYLTAAGSMAKAILDSQLPGKSSPALYALFVGYLKQIPNFASQEPLVASFLLKMLLHEGLLSQTPKAFSLSEQELAHELSYSRSFQKLSAQTISSAFLQKVQDHFMAAIQS